MAPAMNRIPTLEELKPGDPAVWLFRPARTWSEPMEVPVRVVNVTPKRVLVEVLTSSAGESSAGGKIERRVRPELLRIHR